MDELTLIWNLLTLFEQNILIKISGIKGSVARYYSEVKNLTEMKCIRIIVLLDLVFGVFFVYLGAIALISIDTWPRWSGLGIQAAGVFLALRGWSLLSRYRLAMTNVEPWWSFERAVKCVR